MNEIERAELAMQEARQAYESAKSALVKAIIAGTPTDYLRVRVNAAWQKFEQADYELHRARLRTEKGIGQL